MSLTEFSLIERFFTRHQFYHSEIECGIGDDCAVISIPRDYHLVTTTDTMVESVHFLVDADPETLGYKLMAVNLSDLAGMGAKPLAVTLALTLPKLDEKWLSQFSKGLFSLADRYQVDLIGGDTTSGPLTLTLQAMGTLPKGKALMRHKAMPGDLIYVTGTLGDGGLGLLQAQGKWDTESAVALARFHKPDPRVDGGILLRHFATACIDISDGLTGDLGHILRKSSVGALLDWDQLPLSPEVENYVKATGDWMLPLSGGDDYELCFTVSPDMKEKMERQLSTLSCPVTCIGHVEPELGLNVVKDDKIIPLKPQGFEHFRAISQ